MTFKELVEKIVEHIKSENLISQEEFDKSKNSENEIDLKKLSELISADVMAKVHLAIVEESAKQEKEAEKKAAELRVSDLEKREKEVKEKEEKMKEMLKHGAPPIAGRFSSKNISKADEEMRDAVIDARERGTKTVIKSDLNVAHGDHVCQQIEMNKNKADTNFDAAAGYGIEWVPEARGTDLYVRMQTVGDSIHRRFKKKNMTSRTQKVNELLTGVTVKVYSGNQTADKALESVEASALGTDDLTLTSKSFVAKSNLYDDIIEDSIIDSVREHKTDHAIQMNESVDEATINGDTSSPHMDNDTEDIANDPKKAWKGLRYYAITGGLTSDWGSGNLSLANMDKLKVLLGKYCRDPKTIKQVFWLLGIKGINTLEALADFKTAEKAGARLTLFDGRVEKYSGYDLLSTSQMREDLDADGYYDDVTSGQVSTKGSTFLINPSQFIFGVRKKLKTIIVPKPEDDKIIIVSKIRMAFSPYETPSSSISSVAIGINNTA